MSKSNRLEIDLNIINQSLLKYFTFCTKDITFCIYQKSVDNYELSVSLSSLINHIYSESKIKKFNDKIINLLTGKDPVNLITKSRFQKMFQFYDISAARRYHGEERGLQLARRPDQPHRGGAL